MAQAAGRERAVGDCARNTELADDRLILDTGIFTEFRGVLSA
jgi:hypothetical protein